MYTVVLSGGPPWGLRINSNEELRPIVAKTLPGGRADLAGIQIGDQIDSINNQSISSAGQAHAQIQQTKGDLQLRLIRGNNLHPRTTQQSTSNTNKHRSLPSGIPLPRTNPHFRHSPQKQPTSEKTIPEKAGYHFEQESSLHKSPITDRLLQRKIQMGIGQGVPSESTTGYDSVCGDFAGGSFSTGKSDRTSPNSSLTTEEEDRTICEDKLQHETNQLKRKTFLSSENTENKDQMFSVVPESQWKMKTESSNNQPAEGHIEVPGRRSVADLRNAITDKLEMKSPRGVPQRPKTPAGYQNEGRTTPSWNSNSVKVFEGEPAKPYFGRVLDGPVPQNKFFQGVPPPSYNFCPSPAPSSLSSEPQSKPPIPPQNGQKAQKVANLPPIGENNEHENGSPPTHVYQNVPDSSRAQQPFGNTPNSPSAHYTQDYINKNFGNPVTDRNGNDSSINAKHDENENLSTNLSHAHNGVGPNSTESEQNAPRTTVAEGGETASDFYHNLYGGGTDRTVRDIPNQEAAVISHSSINDPRIEMDASFGGEPMISSCITTFDDDVGRSKNDVMQQSMDSHGTQSTGTVVNCESQPHDYPEDPKTSPNGFYPRRASIDLETSELLKSKSPAPFNLYSSANNNHYGTIRRSFTPVSAPNELSSPPATKTFSFSNDSGYGSTPMQLKADSQNFNSFSNSSIPASNEHNFDAFSLDSSRPDRPDSLVSFSTFDDSFQKEMDFSRPFSSPAHRGAEPNHFPTPSFYNREQSRTPTDSVHTVPQYSHGHSGHAPSSEQYSHGPTGSSHHTGEDSHAKLDPAPSVANSSHGRIGPAHPVDGGSHAPVSPAPSRISMDREPEMSLWYKNMFKKMHKLDPDQDSVLRFQLRENSPTPSTISRPLTPTTHASRNAARFECEVTPRRAKSVGRVVEPASPNRFAVERARTVHFHLPSYKFRHEDPRVRPRCVCDSGRNPPPSGEACLRCGRARKDLSWKEIEYIYKSLGPKQIEKEVRNEETQSKMALHYITSRLDSTAKDLEDFIERLDLCWKRSCSSPSISQLTNKKESSPCLAGEIAELKRISKEEEMFRQKAERLTEELEQQRQRRHGYIPSASPSLQKNFDRFDGLMNNYPQKSPSIPNLAPPPNPLSITTATAVYKFVAKSGRELSLNKGDIVRINREVDSNWLEGERNGKVGIFPATYVQLNTSSTEGQRCLRAIYPFTARNENEMNLKLGEIVTYRREIDANWVEGANHIGEIGIFPKVYVKEELDGQETPTVIPSRPKTPKIDTVVPQFEDLSYQSTTRHPAPTVRFEERERDYGNTNGYEERAPASPKLREWQEKQNSSNFTGLAQQIPKGSETYRALYAYHPQKADELGLQVDDIVFVVEKCDDGWFIGTLLRTGEFGTFPGNYVQRH